MEAHRLCASSAGYVASGLAEEATVGGDEHDGVPGRRGHGSAEIFGNVGRISASAGNGGVSNGRAGNRGLAGLVVAGLVVADCGAGLVPEHQRGRPRLVSGVEADVDGGVDAWGWHRRRGRRGWRGWRDCGRRGWRGWLPFAIAPMRLVRCGATAVRVALAKVIVKPREHDRAVHVVEADG